MGHRWGHNRDHQLSLAPNVSAENFFHGTGFSGVERILSRFMGTSTLLQDIAGPMGNKGLEISIKQLMEAKFDAFNFTYSSSASEGKNSPFGFLV